MGDKKFRLLKIVAIICFIYAFVEVGIGLYMMISTESDSKLYATLSAMIDEEDEELKNSMEEYREKIIYIVKILLASIYFIQALFFTIEGALIGRAIMKGKTTLIIVFLLMGFIFPLLTLINAAVHSTYDVNSASSLISLIIKTIILKKVFEIRALNRD